jgi:hypothetical protein
LPVPANAREKVLVELKQPPRRLFADSAPATGRTNYLRFRLSPGSAVALAARVKRAGKEFIGDRRRHPASTGTPKHAGTDEPRDEQPFLALGLMSLVSLVVGLGVHDRQVADQGRPGDRGHLGYVAGKAATPNTVSRLGCVQAFPLTRFRVRSGLLLVGHRAGPRRNDTLDDRSIAFLDVLDGHRGILNRLI